jgi:hypothetical protein
VLVTKYANEISWDDNVLHCEVFVVEAMDRCFGSFEDDDNAHRAKCYHRAPDTESSTVRVLKVGHVLGLAPLSTVMYARRETVAGVNRAMARLANMSSQ